MLSSFLSGEASTNREKQVNHMYIADLHIHSRYSRATSRDCTPEHLDLWARRKGIHILGTGDFTHPGWRQELEDKLVPAEEGFYRLKDELRIKDSLGGRGGSPRFVVSGEISSIYKKNGKVRKVHNVILLPGLSEAELLSRKLETIGNIHSDGRPILGLDSRDLLEITLEICPDAIFVPAHIWTPQFSMFGAFSGFDTIEECFEDLTPYIRAFETGLSSDPPMNWRLSALDHLQMISNSDAHSPAKLGREANLLDIDLCYKGLYDAVQEGKGLKGTIEFFPEEGKYHYDGHRKCNLCLSPGEAIKYHGKCPVCGRKLTLGVSHRIQQLADREDGFIRPEALPFESLVPLEEVIAASTGHSPASAKVRRQYEELLGSLGTEFEILREIPEGDIGKKAGYFIAEGIRRLRQGKVQRFPGFDGEYGIIRLFEPSELDSMDGQISMFGMGDMGLGYEGREKAGILREDRKTEAREEPRAVEYSGAESGPEAGGDGGDTKETESLNQEQLMAVRSISPRIAVAAGPGTGKTRTLVSRVLYLLQNRRVKPSEITAVTFTNKAAQELQSRLEGQLGGKRKLRGLRIGTFHSICYDLLKEAGEKFTLADQETVLEIVREAGDEAGIKGSPGKLRQMISWRKVEKAERENLDTGHVESGGGNHMEESDWKSRPDSIPEVLSLSEADRLLACYQKRLDSLSALDFDDLLVKALRVSEAVTFPYVLVDEFQDISPLQYRLIQAWGKGGREIFIIGDPDQAIYGFRGADTHSFQRFCQEADTEAISLKKNYRSSPEILTASREVLGGGEASLEPVRPSGFPVRLVQARGEMPEAIFAAKEINRLVGGIDMLDTEEGFACGDDRKPKSFGDIGILYRTHRQAELLETCLKKEGIPYVVAGREEFLEEPQVRGSLVFFRSILDPEDGLSRKVCLRLLWNLEESEISQSVYEAMAEKYRKLCGRGKPRNIWNSWRQDMGLTDDEAMVKLGDMAVFYKNMEEMLNALAFGKESDLKRCGGKTYTSDAVTLMTMHGSKGLEFPVVLLLGVRKGMVPLEFKGGETDLEEERRLLYVAMTRAKEELIMTCSGEASVFLQRIPDKIIPRQAVKPRAGQGDGGRQLSLFDFMK